MIFQSFWHLFFRRFNKCQCFSNKRTFTKLDIIPFLFSSNEQGGLFALIVIVSAMCYYRKARYKSILKKYSQENNKERVKGNLFVANYVVLSFLSIFAVAFFKPGKL